MNSRDISFVVQGPVLRKTADRSDITLNCLHSIRTFFPEAEIILSTWVGQNTDGLPYNKLVLSQDPGAILDTNNESINMNRQLVSTQAGLNVASREYAVKFRADFKLTTGDFFRTKPEKTNSDEGFFERKIRMTNLFVQNPLKMPFIFHLSDLIHFGLTKDLIDFWGIPLYQREELLNLDSSIRPLGTYLGSSARMRNEQALPLGFLKKRGHDIRLSNPNDFDLKNYRFFEKFLVHNFEIVDWQESGIAFPPRMMDSFLETVYTSSLLEQIADDLDGGDSRFKRAIFSKRYLFLTNRAYLFHLKKAAVAKFPSLNPFFKSLKRVQKIIFRAKLLSADEARAKQARLYSQDPNLPGEPK